MHDDAELIYIHDPMCSWCWGFRPTFESLCAQLPRGLGVRRLLGGLAADNDQPMPAEMRAYLQATWRRIAERIPGTRFNHAFWTECTPRRSTWPACRAVIVARQLDPATETLMIDAIQRAYYLQARNPSEHETLIELADAIGLDANAFQAQLDAQVTRAVLDTEMAEARSMGADSFPSLRLRLADQYWPVPVDYTHCAPMLAAIRERMAATEPADER
ncbi:MAG: DsbA family protein [Gammaproteobacteria bacterium]|nr:DsbA family protein [Gammaproteobacteria bacterium]